MKNISVRELRGVIPRLGETLQREKELVLVSHGEPVARILPIDALAAPRLESLKWLRDQAPRRSQGTEHLIREDRDRRGT